MTTNKPKPTSAVIKIITESCVHILHPCYEPECNITSIVQQVTNNNFIKFDVHR